MQIRRLLLLDLFPRIVAGISSTLVPLYSALLNIKWNLEGVNNLGTPEVQLEDVNKLITLEACLGDVRKLIAVVAHLLAFHDAQVLLEIRPALIDLLLPGEAE